MRFLITLALLCFPAVSYAGMMPWDLQGNFTLGLERGEAPWIEEDAEQKYDLGLQVTKPFGLVRGINSYVRLQYLYENWYNLEDRNQAHTYRAEWSVTF